VAGFGVVVDFGFAIVIAIVIARRSLMWGFHPY